MNENFWNQFKKIEFDWDKFAQSLDFVAFIANSTCCLMYFLKDTLEKQFLAACPHQLRTISGCVPAPKIKVDIQLLVGDH